MKVDQSTIAGTFAGAVAVVLIWLFRTLAHQDVPAEIAMALSVIIQALVTHFVPNSPQDQWTQEQRAAHGLPPIPPPPPRATEGAKP